MKRKIIISFTKRDNTKLLAPRRYTRLSTAIPRATQLLMEYGEPGSVAELAHAEHGFQIGTVKIHVGGKLSINFDSSLAKYGEER